MRKTALVALALIAAMTGSDAIAAAGGGTPADPSPEGVFSITPVQQRSCIAVKFDLNAAQALAGIRWHNNDDQTPFAHILVASGRDGVPPLYADAVPVASDIAGGRIAWSELEFAAPVAGQTGALYVIFQLAEDVEGVGTADGPGIGYVSDPEGNCVFLSADGDDWTRFRTGFRLLVEPIIVAREPGMAALAMSRPEAATTADLPKLTGLGVPYPNPFNPQVTIGYDLARPADVSLKIFDVRGRLVTELAQGPHTAGRHVVQWYGSDRRGARMASGVYFVRFVAGEQEFTRRVVMVK